MRAGEPLFRRGVFFLLVHPGVVIAATVGVERVGVPGSAVLVLCALVWISALLRYAWRDRKLVLPMLGLLAMTALGIFLLRPALPPKIPEELAEVLFRELLRDAAPGRIYFVEVDGKDPSPGLLDRLGDLGVRLKPGSSAMIGGRDFPREEYEKATRENVKDRDSGEYGTLLRVGNLARVGWWYLVSLSVDIGSQTGGLSASGRRCLVMRLRGWRITGFTMTWVA